MPVGVAGGVAAPVGKVFWRFDYLCPRSLRPFVVRVDTPLRSHFAPNFNKRFLAPYRVPYALAFFAFRARA
jgi:hypothetical protein